MRFSNLLFGIPIAVLLVACQSDRTSIEIPETEKNLIQESLVWDSLVLKPNEGLVYKLDQPFTGLAVKYYPGGSKASAEAYFKGKREGHFEKWFESGINSYTCPYVEGKREGTASSWWRNGNIRSETNYSADVPHGKQKQWYVSGSLFKVLQLNQGKEEGIQQSWR